jgi:hypothetical protein
MKALIRIAVVLALVATCGCGKEATVHESNSPSNQSAGPGLRHMILTTDPAKLAFAADADFPVVYGVVVDWPIDNATASIVALRDGTASLYTNSTFGIIGGSGHEKVRSAARACVLLAGDFAKACEPVTDYPYPPDNTVYYYLLTYSGVRRCSVSLSALEGGSDPTYPLFEAAQNVLTQLRLVVEAEDAAGTSP